MSWTKELKKIIKKYYIKQTTNKKNNALPNLQLDKNKGR